MSKPGLFFVAACSLLLLACSAKTGGDEGNTQPVTPVQVAPAKRGSIAHIVTAEAVLHPLQQATITPKISAPVQKFFVQRGDHVHEGQVLALLEDRDLRAAVQESKNLYQQAEASYENTKAATMPDDLAKAKADEQTARQALDAAQAVYENRVQLFKEGALAHKLVDDAKVALVQAQSQFNTSQQHLTSLQTAGRAAQLKSAQAQMEAAKAHYESSQAQLSYAEVRSPMSGIVSDRPVNIGEMASSGSALLSVVDISQVVARANIPIQEAAAMRVGDPATISGSGVKLSGKIIVVSPAVDPNTTTLQVWVGASNPGERMKLGLTVQIAVNIGDVRDATIVPVSALLASEEGGEQVMIAGSDGLAHASKVETGVRDGDAVQILNGVRPGDLVITDGALGLDDKAKIEIKKPGGEAESTSGADSADKK
ncbi:MAG TPA: efflux RND transporter periplasmic adaptor subunit [Bryobacteraceae bacterium]|jgi:RND family efflux transporter MFP subunit